MPLGASRSFCRRDAHFQLERQVWLNDCTNPRVSSSSDLLVCRPQVLSLCIATQHRNDHFKVFRVLCVCGVGIRKVLPQMTCHDLQHQTIDSATHSGQLLQNNGAVLRIFQGALQRFDLPFDTPNPRQQRLMSRLVVCRGTRALRLELGRSRFSQAIPAPYS